MSDSLETTEIVDLELIGSKLDSTRGQFLRNSGKGAIALVAGGSVFAMAEGVAFGQTAGDKDILKLAATAELLAIDVYTKAIGSGLFKGATKKYLTNARKNERDHYDFLADALGSDAPKNLKFKYPSGALKSASSVVNLGVTLETAFVGAYLTGVKEFSSQDLKMIAAQVGSNEASHLGFLLNAQGKGRTLASVPKPLSAAKASAAVGGFIKM